MNEIHGKKISLSRKANGDWNLWSRVPWGLQVASILIIYFHTATFYFETEEKIKRRWRTCMRIFSLTCIYLKPFAGVFEIYSQSSIQQRGCVNARFLLLFLGWSFCCCCCQRRQFRHATTRISNGRTRTVCYRSQRIIPQNLFKAPSKQQCRFIIMVIRCLLNLKTRIWKQSPVPIDNNIFFRLPRSHFITFQSLRLAPLPLTPEIINIWFNDLLTALTSPSKWYI